MYKCQHDTQIDQFQFKDLENIFDFGKSKWRFYEVAVMLLKTLWGRQNRIVSAEERGSSMYQLKNKTSFGESLLWLYIVIHTVSAGGDIYSSLEVCQCGRMLLFLE